MSNNIIRRAIDAHHSRTRNQEAQEKQRVQNQTERALRLVEEHKGEWASAAGLRLFGASNAPETNDAAWFVLDETKEAWELHGAANNTARARAEHTKEKQPFYVAAAIEDNVVVVLRLRTPGLEVGPGLFAQIDGGPVEQIEGLPDLGQKLESAGYDRG